MKKRTVIHTHNYVKVALLLLIIIGTCVKSNYNKISREISIAVCLEKLNISTSIYTGENVTVAIIDTGIAQHPDLSGSIVEFIDFTSGEVVPYDDNGHGTATAGIITGNGTSSNGKYIGIAPNSKIVSLKVFGLEDTSNINIFEAAIDWLLCNVTKYNIKIVCVPLGYDMSSSTLPMLTEKIIKLSENCIIVAAAGNNKEIRYPGSINEVLAVGSIKNFDTFDEDAIIDNLSHSLLARKLTHKPELFAPGNNIVVLKNNEISEYDVMSGTSLSAAFVTGILALLFEEYPDKSPSFYIDFLIDYCDNRGVIYNTNQ